MTARVLSGIAAARVLGRWTLRRLLRGRLVWLSLGLAALPVVAFVVFAGQGPSVRVWRELYGLLIAVMTVVAAMHFAPAIGEEIEDKTFTYLWSRPFPRWALVAGKFAALVPATTVLLCAMTAGAFAVVFRGQAGQFLGLVPDGLTAMIMGLVAASALCSGIGSVIPRHAMAISLVYLLVLDTSVAFMPFSIHNLTIRYQVDDIAMNGIAASNVAWLAGISVFWLTVAIRRISTAEYATDK